MVFVNEPVIKYLNTSYNYHFMKISKLIGMLFISGSLLAFTANKAAAYPHEHEQHEGKNDRGRGGDFDHLRGGDRFRLDGHDRDGRGDQSVSLPINNQSWLLLIAGLSIGSFMILDKSKALR